MPPVEHRGVARSDAEVASKEALATLLTQERRSRADDEAGATREMAARLRSGPLASADLRAELEGALAEVASRAARAMITLEGQRHDSEVHPDAVSADVKAAAAALRLAELASAVLAAAVPVTTD